MPTVKDKIDFVLNYQKDNNPGLGYMSMSYPNTDDSTNPYNYVTSLEHGHNLANDREIFDATLILKHFFNENNYLTSISSIRKISTYTRWDGDGTAAPGTVANLPPDPQLGSLEGLELNIKMFHLLFGEVTC